MNNNIQIKKVEKLYKLFQEGKIPTLPQHEVNPNHPINSRENYLYFTLPVCLNFQRNSPSLWLAALNTYNDKATRYLFLPEEVVKKDSMSIQSDLVKHKLALQPNKHSFIWTSICKTLNQYYMNDPRNIIKESDSDVDKILESIQLKKKKLFPYLSGPKLSNYWLYILNCYTDVNLKNKNNISIIPDTHIIQSSIKLGISEEVDSPKVIADKWKDLLKSTDISTIDMHPVLWNWSRNNFLPVV